MPDITWYLNIADRDLEHPIYKDVIINKGKFFTHLVKYEDWVNDVRNPQFRSEFCEKPTLEEALAGCKTYVDIWVAPRQRKTSIVLDTTLKNWIFDDPSGANSRGGREERGIRIHKGRRRENPNGITPNLSEFRSFKVSKNSDKISFKYQKPRPPALNHAHDTVFLFDLFLISKATNKRGLWDKMSMGDTVMIDPIIRNDGEGPPPPPPPPPPP